ncbi:MAG: site-specific integrase [Gemmataceae bacterium]
MLGRWKSPESKAEFGRIVAELAAASPEAMVPKSADGITVSRVLALFWDHAETHYHHPDGTPTGELPGFRDSLKPVRRLYGHVEAVKFGPLALKAVRQAMIDAGLTRKLINQRVGRIKRVFKWAASEQLVPVAVHTALATVTGLQVGRSNAREADPIEPVSDELVDATLPFMNRHVRGLVEFQRLTGCRPGEACRIRRVDIDTTKKQAWTYRPAGHKTAWRGKARVIAIGPKAQTVLHEFLTFDPNEYLFSPRRAMAEFRSSQREQRKTPVQTSQQQRSKAKPKKQPGDHYTSRSYFAAVLRACKLAFPLPEHLQRREGETPKAWRGRLTPEQRAEVKAWWKTHHWCPLQLRHSFGTTTRKLFDLEHAGAALGHTKMNATEIYALRDQSLAEAVAVKIG